MAGMAGSVTVSALPVTPSCTNRGLRTSGPMARKGIELGNKVGEREALALRTELGDTDPGVA